MANSYLRVKTLINMLLKLLNKRTATVGLLYN